MTEREAKLQTGFIQFAAAYCATQETTPQELREIMKEKVRRYEPIGFMLLRCEMLDSLRIGEHVILPFGPNNTFKELPSGPISPRGLAPDMSVVVGWIPASEILNLITCAHCGRAVPDNEVCKCQVK